MSETQTAVAPVAPETPTPTTAPIVDGAAAVVVTPKPASPMEARRSLRERVTGPASVSEEVPAAPVEPSVTTVAETETPSAEAATEPVVDAQGNLHGPDGKFLPKAGEESGPAADAAPETTTAADQVPEGFVRIPVPEGHPLRDRGREFVDAPKADEDYHRWALNNAVRRADLERAIARTAEVEEQLLREQARNAARQKVTADPQTLAAIEEVRAFDPNLAALMEMGLEVKVQKEADTEFQTLASQRVEAEVQAIATQFQSDTYQRFVLSAPADMRHVAQEAYEQAAVIYGTRLDQREAAGEKVQPDAGEFAEVFKRTLATHPKVASAIEQRRQQEIQQEAARAAEAARAKAEADAAERERQRLEEAATRRRTNPLGGLAMGNAGGDAVPAARPANPIDARRTLRDRMRSAVR